MKRLLVLADYFPPRGGIGSTRLMSFMRHLDSHGWELSVVTIDWNESNSSWIDESLLAPELWERVLLRTFQPDLRREKGKLPPLLSPRLWRRDPGATLRHLWYRVTYGNRLNPYGSWYFIGEASRFLRRHLRERHYDAILSTAPELASHKIAKDLAARFRIPWVADCRDDFAANRPRPEGHLRAEQKLLTTADMITTLSHGLKESLEARLGREVRVIENGFEDEWLEAPAEGSPHLDPKTFNLVYTGTLAHFYPHSHSPEMVFAAADQFLARRPEAEGRFAIHFFGDRKVRGILDEFTAKFPRLRGVLRDRGRVSRDESMAVQRAADVLIILAHRKFKGILTGKVFEYMAARRPVLCLPGDDGELDDLLSRTRIGVLPRTVEAGADYLERAFAQWDEKGAFEFETDIGALAPYRRKRLTRKLADVLDEVSDAGRSATKTGPAAEQERRQPSPVP